MKILETCSGKCFGPPSNSDTLRLPLKLSSGIKDTIESQAWIILSGKID